METIELNLLSDLEQYKDEYGYYIPGNVKAYFNTAIKGNLRVGGFFKSENPIEIDGSIRTNGSIEVYSDIKVSGFIKAVDYIEASGFIEAGEFIQSDGHIVSNNYIQAGRFILAGSSITAESSITAGSYIKSNEHIHSGWSIKSNNYIKADGFIESGWSIQSGDGYGISAGVYISCKNGLSSGQKIFAGTCVWGELDDRDKTITCEKLIRGVVEYGILKETGKEKNTIEMTLKEVAEKIGVDVEKLRIKDKE